VNTGETLISRAAVPAGTVRSPALSSSWYAVIPANPTAAIAGTSRAAGSPTPRAAATAPRASAATSSRSTLRCPAPTCSSAARIAANADAHSNTVAASAAAGRSGIRSPSQPHCDSTSDGSYRLA
jgi:hypothetical protein